MALIPCKDCKKEYSPDSKRCPNCGAINRSADKLIYSGIVIACLFFAGVFLTLSPDDDYTPPPAVQKSQEQINLDLARFACQTFVKKTLHDPDSAEFDDMSSYWAQLKKEVYEVQVTLRARNGFNALRRLTIDCKVTRLPNGDWIAVKLQETN